MRAKKPDMERPFKLGWNIRIFGWELPITAIIGLISTFGIWIIILITQPYSRSVGLIWMFVGLIVYCIYRWKSRLPLTHLPKEPEEGGL